MSRKSRNTLADSIVTGIIVGVIVNWAMRAYVKSPTTDAPPPAVAVPTAPDWFQSGGDFWA